jgi:hypothetical protein
MRRLLILLLFMGATLAEPSKLVLPVTNPKFKTYVKNIFSRSGSAIIPCSRAIRDGGYPDEGDLPFQFSLTRYPPQGACAIFTGNPRWLIQSVFTTKPSSTSLFYFNSRVNTFLRGNFESPPFGPGGTIYEVVKGVETRNGTLWYITIAGQI